MTKAQLSATVESFAPRHWYRGDTYNAGATLTALVNRGTAGGLMPVDSGSLSVPYSDPTQGGGYVVDFTGSQRLKSSLAPGEFRYLHTGVASHLFAQFCPNGDIVATQGLLSTVSSSLGFMMYRSHLNVLGTFSGDGAVSVINTVGGALPLEVPNWVEARFSLALAPDYTQLVKTTVGASPNVAAAPVNADPDVTLYIGASGVGGVPGTLFLKARLADVISFDRILTSVEADLVRAYLGRMYS